jgi:uracil-DNA glycosylase family protein
VPSKPNAPPGIDSCRRCGLWEHATQAVGGEGAPRAAIMLVGEQPGDREDLAGRPFVGPAGALLDAALAEAGIARASVYLTNAVKHFKWTPRGKRRMHKTPAQREVEACAFWLAEELARVQPQVVVALGSTALKAVMGDPHATLAAAGKPVRRGAYWVVASYHPAFALRALGEPARQEVRRAIVASLLQARRLAAGGQHTDEDQGKR